MPRHTTIALQENVWTEITAADVTHITFGSGARAVKIMVTEDATAPTSTDGALTVLPGYVGLNIALADLAPGLTGVRVFALCNVPGGEVSVSHA